MKKISKELKDVWDEHASIVVETFAAVSMGLALIMLAAAIFPDSSESTNKPQTESMIPASDLVADTGTPFTTISKAVGHELS